MKVTTVNHPTRAARATSCAALVLAVFCLCPAPAGASPPLFALSPAAGGCLEQASSFLSIGDEGCGVRESRGLLGATALAVSPDGRNVYVVTGEAESEEVQSSSIVELARDSSGGLSEIGCISETGAECDVKANGLTEDDSVAVSPDGTRVYVGSPVAGLDVFERNAEGVLTLLQCFKRSSDSGDSTCSTVSPDLEGVRGIAVSPDGRFLYAAEQNGNAIATFARTASNTLEYTGCVSEEAMGGLTGCAIHTAVGLIGVTGLALSPNGEQLYAVSYSDNALVTFNRNAATGEISGERGCESGDGGAAGCSVTNAGGLGNAQNVVVNAEGTRIYVVTLEGALSTFTPSAGGTTELGCLSARGKEAACTAAGASLEGGAELVLAPKLPADEYTLYSTGLFSKAVNAFVVEPITGLPEPLPAGESCIQATGASAGCAASAPGLNRPDGIAVSPDGSDVYVASRGAQSVQCASKKCTDTVAAVTGFQRPVAVPAGIPPAEGTTGSGTGSGKAAAPVLSHVRLTPATVYRKRHGRRRGGPDRALLAYTDSADASTTITFELLTTGVRRSRRCVRGRAHSRRLRCERHAVVGHLSHNDRVGSNSVTVSLRLGKRGLVPGRYRLVLIARNRAGLSRPVSVTLRIA